MRPDAFRYAVRGIALTFAAEANLRVHLAVAEAVLYVAAVEGLPRIEWAALILAIALVLAIELVNTAIERAVDLTVGQRMHPLAAAAKDAAAGAVLLAAAGAAAVGFVILWPRLGRLQHIFASAPLALGLVVLALAVFLTFRPPVRRAVDRS